MPEYFFHLTFELYPSRSSSKTQYTPPPQTDIFTSELPVHGNASWGSFSPAPQISESFAKSAVSYRDVAQLSASRDRPAPTRRFSQRTRPSFSDHHESPVPIVKPPKRPGHKRTQSFAHRDWRFDAISILSIDMSASNGDELTRSRSKSLKHPAQAQSSGGLATKGKFVPSGLKDTEVGYGVVHLYRDGQETPGLYDEVDAANKDFNEEDCTTLCILAVPSYMTPSDFLGFVGERTREDVSHFRLIKTSRANKYMVLMKFRDAKQAREWRKEWNGKAFNSMEVRIAMKTLLSPWLTSISPNTAMSSSSSQSTSKTATRIVILPLTQTLPMILSLQFQQSSQSPLCHPRQVSRHPSKRLR
jgi:BRCA1-associated protein